VLKKEERAATITSTASFSGGPLRGSWFRSESRWKRCLLNTLAWLNTSGISDSVLNLSTNYCLTDIQLKYV